MLIVAIPKSASSSLVASLRAATGYPRSNPEIRRKFLTAAAAPADYRQLKRFHNEIAELSDEVVAAVTRPRQFSKLHIVPTENNLSRLRDIPKVVLLRPAEEIVAAYWRGMDTSTWTTSVKDIAVCESQDQWLQTARDIGLTAELEAFNQRWQDNPGNSLLLSYRQLTTESEATIASVLDYFGLDVGKVPELGRVNYSRDGGAGTHLHRRLFFTLRRAWARVAGN